MNILDRYYLILGVTITFLFFPTPSNSQNIPDEAYLEIVAPTVDTIGWVYLSFKWIQNDPGFTQGQAFEIGGFVDPKFFGQPLGGEDKNPNEGFLFTGDGESLECGYRDVLNYVSAESTDEAGELIQTYCPHVDFNNIRFRQPLLRRLTDVDDSVGNYSVGTTCPEIDFRRNVQYEAFYYLEATDEVLNENDAANEGYAWVNIQISEDTCLNTVDCPFSFGEAPFGYCDGPTTVWHNRVCAPTEIIQFTPLEVTQSFNSHCVDEDDDGYFQVQDEIMYGSNVGDCDDENRFVDNSRYDSNINSCSYLCPVVTLACDNIDDDCGEGKYCDPYCNGCFDCRPEVCMDGLDDDCDGFTDEEDSDCGGPDICSINECPSGEWCEPLAGVCRPCGGCPAMFEEICEAQCDEEPSVCPNGTGLYCGRTSNGHNPDHLYYCQAGVWEHRSTCDGNGCVENGNQDSYCELPNCPSGPGLYCGIHSPQLDSEMLYYCEGNTWDPICSCEEECISNDPGEHDICEPTVPSIDFLYPFTTNQGFHTPTDGPVAHSNRGVHGLNQDVDCREGDPIGSLINGIVEEVRDDQPGDCLNDGIPDSYGNYVCIRNLESGIRVCTSHLETGSLLVDVGCYVRAGDIIAACGKSGTTSCNPGDHVDVRAVDRYNNVISMPPVNNWVLPDSLQDTNCVCVENLPALESVELESPTNGTSLGRESLTVAWGSVTEATRYRLRIGEQASDVEASSEDCSGCTVEVVLSGNQTSFIVPSGILEPNTRYYWSVRAGALNRGSEFADSWSFTTPERSQTCSVECSWSGDSDPTSTEARDTNESQVIYLSLVSSDSCGALGFIARKDDRSDLGPGTYYLRTGTCLNLGEGHVVDQINLTRPSNSISFTIEHRGPVNEEIRYCVSKLADVEDPESIHHSWWNSNFVHVTSQCNGDTDCTCAAHGYSCGSLIDVCGEDVDCGPCSRNQVCTNGTCVDDCIPSTCEGLNKECGTWPAGCEQMVTCPRCSDGEECNTEGVCVEEQTPLRATTVTCDSVERGTSTTCYLNGSGFDPNDNGGNAHIDCFSVSSWDVESGTRIAVQGTWVCDCELGTKNAAYRNSDNQRVEWQSAVTTILGPIQVAEYWPTEATEGTEDIEVGFNGCNFGSTPVLFFGGVQLSNHRLASEDQALADGDVIGAPGTQEICVAKYSNAPIGPDKWCCSNCFEILEGECVPETCPSLGYVCGRWSDSCGGTLNCGNCTTPDTCSQGQCRCTPNSCRDLGYECGTWSDGCNDTVSCGSCPGDQVCNGQGECEDMPECWTPSSMSASDSVGDQGNQTIPVGLEAEVRVADNFGNLEMRICKDSGDLQNSLDVYFEDWFEHNGLTVHDRTLRVDTNNPQCTVWGGLINENSFEPGTSIGGQIRVVSPSNCSSDWGRWCNDPPDPGCGTCWYMNTGTMERVCP